jgi:2-phosphosulfolactate phosphatase
VTLQIQALDYVAGARAARGVAVIIDVFRACSVACHAVAGGVQRILPVADADEALRLRRAEPKWLAIGERHARPLPGFDCGNSPTQLMALDLAGRTLVHTTHAGTQGLTGASGADIVLTGALVNAAAVCRYIQRLAPREVSLVRMGLAASERSDADDLCAELLEARLTGRPTPTEPEIREQLRSSPEAQKFFDPQASWAPEQDFALCTELDCFGFVLQLAAPDSEGRRFLHRVDLP